MELEHNCADCKYSSLWWYEYPCCYRIGTGGMHEPKEEEQVSSDG